MCATEDEGDQKKEESRQGNDCRGTGRDRKLRHVGKFVPRDRSLFSRKNNVFNVQYKTQTNSS
eukprot:269138-Rhodomonas_salina.1